MDIDKLKEEGYYVYGAGEYIIRDGRKVFETIIGVEIWKHDGSYYWVEEGKVSLLQPKNPYEERNKNG